MNEDDFARHLDGAAEGNAHIAHRDRHGIAIDDDEAALRIDDQAGTVIVLFGDAGNRIRHVEADRDQGWRQTIDARIAALGKLRLRRPHRRGLGPGCDAHARPCAEYVVTFAFTRRKPAPVDVNDLELRRTRILDGHVTHGRAGAIGQIRKGRLEIR
jgi:hypothetical protein